MKANNDVVKIKNRKLWTGIITALVLIVVPVILFYVQEFMICNPFVKMKAPLHVLNVSFWILFMLFFYIWTGSLRVAVWITTFIATAIGVLDHYLIEFRGTPLQPWDIPSLKVAMSVADNYKWTISADIVIPVGIMVIVAVGAYFIRIKLMPVFVKTEKGSVYRKGQIARAILMVLILVFLIGFAKYIQSDKAVSKFKIYNILFTPTVMTYKDGTAIAFLIEEKYLFVDKPVGYTDKKALNILDEYNNDGCVGNAEVADNKVSDGFPNIIVIMDEAFGDLGGQYQEATGEDILPFVHSLMNGADNTMSGYLDVSVLGGNTADTEYEFLTGDTMAFLPQGSIPYQQYIRKDTESMASLLNKQGYLTVAMHPYKPRGWNRDKIYDYFGFDRFYSIEDYDNAYYLRKYVSDMSDFEKIVEVYENKGDDKPLFLFNVTMQNHSSYTDLFDNFTPHIEVPGVDKVATNQYLSLINKTDEAFEYLVNYFSNADEPVIIVFFGDHQPTDSVVAPLYRLDGENVYDLSASELYLRYQTPFIVWANYDIPEAANVEISPGLLGAKVIEIAGVKRSPYINFLLDAGRQIDSINIMRVLGKDGKWIEDPKSLDVINKYQILQYYHLFNRD